MNPPTKILVRQKEKTRQSISFSKEQHASLAKIAADNDVSICWVVRHACEMLVKNYDKSELLDGLKSGGGL